MDFIIYQPTDIPVSEEASTEEWLTLAGRSLEFWDNEKDAQYDSHPEDTLDNNCQEE